MKICVPTVSYHHGWLSTGELPGIHQNHHHRPKARLLKILRGNLLNISKAFSYTIPDLDSVKGRGSFRTVSRNFHNIPMHCFTGRFGMNFKIPDHLALGKQVTRGFGVVECYKEEKMIHKMLALYDFYPSRVH